MRGVFALLTHVSGASTASLPPLESELNLTFTTVQKGQSHEKEEVGIKLSYTNGVLNGVKVSINSDAELEEKTTKYTSLPSNQDLAALILKKLTAKKKYKHPIDLTGIYNLLKEIIERYEDGDATPKKDKRKKRASKLLKKT